MNNTAKLITLPVIAVLIFCTSCNTDPDSQVQASAPETGAQGDWIKGTEQEKIQLIEKQFRGFDNAMVETGYRYQELYWAGQDENWDYANYQLEKIRTAIENGLQRRPKRAESAKTFLNTILPDMQDAIYSKDITVFNANFSTLTTNCNGCHAMENVPFFTVQIPSERQSPIRK